MIGIDYRNIYISHSRQRFPDCAQWKSLCIGKQDLADKKLGALLQGQEKPKTIWVRMLKRPTTLNNMNDKNNPFSV